MYWRNALSTSRRRRVGKALRRQWPDIVIVAVLAILPALFFWRLITPNVADRLSIATGDFTEQYYPLRSYAAAEMVAGHLPLWNPAVYGGQPALADIQSGALYPPQILEAFVLSGLGLGFPLQALEWQVILRFSWAAVGAYLLGKRLALHAGNRPGSGVSARGARLAGTVVSLVFTYSGYLTGFPVQQLTILEVSAWLPWVLLALDSLAASLTGSKRQLAGGVAWAAVALGLSLLPGHPQTWLYVLYAGVGFYLWRAFWGQSRADSWLSPRRYWLTAIGALAATLGLTLSLTAAQWLPTLEFIVRSPRADMSYEAVSFGLPLHELVSLVYPGYFGGSPAYVGILPMVLIGLALALGQPRRQVIFWTLAGLLALLLAFGGNTFLYSLFYLAVPGFEVVRHQERAFLVYALSAAVLSGYGALVLVRPLNRLERATFRGFSRGTGIILGVGLALTALFLYGWVASEHRDLFAGVLRHHVFGLVLLAGSLILLAIRPARHLRRPWGMVLLVGWIAFNLFSVNWRFNLEPPQPSGAFPATPLTDYLRDQVGSAPQPVRLASAGLLPGGPSAASVYGLQDITGNTPLHLAAIEDFEAIVPEWRRWQLLNVHYVLSDRDLAGAGMVQVFPPYSQEEGEEGHTRVYRMGDPFPRAWVVHAIEIVTDEEAALARLSQDGFDLRRVAVVNEVNQDPGLSFPGPADGSTARVTRFSPSELVVDVEAVADGLLVLSEVSYPGWRASIDGVPASLLRANGLLRGVPIPAGRHTVRVWYASTSVRLGLVISALTVIAGLAGWVLGRRRKTGPW